MSTPLRPEESSRSEEQALFDAACVGRLDDRSRSELGELLRRSPDARRRYLDYTAMHADLFGVVRTARVRQRLIALLDAGPDDQPLTPTPTPARVSTRGAGRRAAVAALAIAATLLVALAVWPADEPAARVAAADDVSRPAGPSDEAGPANRWPGLIAKVNRVEAAEWGVGARRLAPTEMLASGAVVALTSGLIEIEFRQGAVVLLEGPAELVAENANAATLNHGKLAAVAPPWATGFRVDTPGVDVVDHGTEFAMNVSGEEDEPQVNVVVTEGEVEVLAGAQTEGGRRLRAGEGVQSTGATVRDGDDAAARELTEKLLDRPEHKNTVVVGDRWEDWRPGTAGEPRRDGAWRYYTNSGGEFGDPSAYEELLWNPSSWSYRPGDHDAASGRHQFVRVHRDGGHPGKGSSQVEDGIDRYSVTGFVVPEDGKYRIEAGWLERLWVRRWDRDHVLDIAVHVNDRPVTMRKFCNRNCFVEFRCVLGELAAGDTIYVGVGPNGADFNDRFRWGFYVVRDREGRTDEEDFVASD